MIQKIIFVLVIVYSSSMYGVGQDVLENKLSKNGEVFQLPLISQDRIAGHVLKMQRTLKRATRARSVAYTGISLAVLGFCAYSIYDYCSEQLIHAHSDINLYSDDIGKVYKSARHKYKIEELIQKEKDRTFVGGVKRSVKNGLQMALCSAIVGAVVAGITKGTDLTSDTISAYFTFDDKAIFKMLFNRVNSSVKKVSESVFKLAYNNDQAVAWYLASDLMVDFAAFVFVLETVIALLVVVKPDDERLQSNINAIEQSVSCGAQNIEKALQSFDYDINLLVAACRRMQVLVTKFLCACGESLYGHDFFQS